MTLLIDKKQEDEKILISEKKQPLFIEPAKSGALLTSKTQKFNKKRFLLGIAAGILIIIILGLVIFGFGIYRFGWEGDIVQKITKVIPYPAAFVNHRVVRFSDYAEDIRTLEYIFENQGQDILGAEVPSEKELRERVLEKLIQNELVYQLAKKYGIKISSGEVEAEMEKIIKQDGSLEDVKETLKNQYGWEIDQFKKKVLEPFLVQQKLQEAMSRDEDLNKEAKKKAEDVLTKIRDGEKSFEELAEEYSEDATASEGGDLGYFGKGVMVTEFENAAFGLGVSETSDLVLTNYGYHIIKVEEQIKNEAGEVEEVRARHILIRTKDLGQLLEEETARAKIWKLVRI